MNDSITEFVNQEFEKGNPSSDDLADKISDFVEDTISNTFNHVFENLMPFMKPNKIKKVIKNHKINTFTSKGYEYLDDETIDDIKYGVSNHDWYIYVDNNDVIHKEIIGIDNRAQIEFDEYLKEVENTYGGTSWHIV